MTARPRLWTMPPHRNKAPAVCQRQIYRGNRGKLSKDGDIRVRSASTLRGQSAINTRSAQFRDHYSGHSKAWHGGGSHAWRRAAALGGRSGGARTTAKTARKRNGPALGYVVGLLLHSPKLASFAVLTTRVRYFFTLVTSEDVCVRLPPTPCDESCWLSSYDHSRSGLFGDLDVGDDHVCHIFHRGIGHRLC